MIEQRKPLNFVPADIKGESPDSLQQEVDLIYKKAMELFPDIPFLRGLKSVLAASKDVGSIPIAKAASNYFNQEVATRGIDRKKYSRQIAEFESFLHSLEKKHP